MYLSICICTALLKASGFGWEQSYWNCRDTTKCNQIKFCNHPCDYSSQNMQNITIIHESAGKTIITQTREVGAYLFKVIACL